MNKTPLSPSAWERPWNEDDRPNGGDSPNIVIRRGEYDGVHDKHYCNAEVDEWERVLYEHGHAAGKAKADEASRMNVLPARQVGKSGAAQAIQAARAMGGITEQPMLNRPTATCGFMCDAFHLGLKHSFTKEPTPDYKTNEMATAYGCGLRCGHLTQSPEGAGPPSPVSAAQLTQSELLKVLSDVVCGARSEELETAQRNVRHWRDECGKLHARIKILEAPKSVATIKVNIDTSDAIEAIKRLKDAAALPVGPQEIALMMENPEVAKAVEALLIRSAGALKTIFFGNP